MPLSSLLLPVASCIFLGAGLAAALGDIRKRRISNRLVVALASGAPLLVVGGHLSPALFAISVAISSGLMLLGTAFFSRGWIGGGDVKLICATAIWFPPVDALRFVYLALVFGGVLAILVLMLRGLARRGVVPIGESQRQLLAADLCVPYGVSIAAAGATVFLLTWF